MKTILIGQSLRILILGLLILISPINVGYAITFEEFSFRLDEAERQKKQAVKEIEALSAKLNEMTQNSSPIKHRKAYAEEIIKVIAYMEKLRKDLAELKALLPQVNVRARLKLVSISPTGIPGAIQKRVKSNGIAYQMISLRVSQYPLEIIPDQRFTVSGDIIMREQYPPRHTCKIRSDIRNSSKDPKLGFQTYRNIVKNLELIHRTTGKRELNFKLEGNKRMLPMCDDAPTDTDPETGRVLQAEFEKESRIKFTAEFIPTSQKKLENGSIDYLYRMKISSNGTLLSQNLQGVLVTQSSYTTGPGFCTGSNYQCSELAILLHGNGPGVSLNYKQIDEGEVFIASATQYHHPVTFNRPPKIGTIRLATMVPQVIGLSKVQAERKIEMADLKTNIDQYVPAPNTNLVGTVKHIRPKAGTTLKLGASVNLALYSAQLKVPSVVGLSIREAKREMIRLGLVPELSVGSPAPTEHFSAKVAQQYPVAGQGVQAGSRVRLILYGPFVDLVSVPRLMDMSSKIAKQLLDRAGLKYIFNIEGAPTLRQLQGVVKQQNPEYGVQVARGSEVRLVVWGPISNIKPEESCNNNYPGSIPSSERSAQGGISCLCPLGKQWNNNTKTHCVDKSPVPTDEQICARYYDGSVPTGRRGSNGAPECNCPTGKKWNTTRTQCINTLLPLSDAQLCARDLFGSVPTGRRGSNGGAECKCPQGKKWNARKTGCIADTPVQSRDPLSQRSQGCSGKRWREKRVVDFGFHKLETCVCKYGNSINGGLLCLPPKPRGHVGCPPHTRGAYDSTGLGYGCECIYGSDGKGACKIP